jgi:hypothetical protein
MNEASHGTSRFLSCVALLIGVALSLLAAVIFAWQCLGWLEVGEWPRLPLRTLFQPRVSWVGLQIILDWIFALPLALIILTIGVITFRLIGMLSDSIYKTEAERAGKVPTPSQL